jgi:hypothetical protein
MQAYEIARMNRLPVSPLVMRGLEISEKHLGMAELSTRLGAPEETIRAWRLGHVEMPDKQFLRLVDVLADIDPSWLSAPKRTE